MDSLALMIIAMIIMFLIGLLQLILKKEVYVLQSANAEDRYYSSRVKAKKALGNPRLQENIDYFIQKRLINRSSNKKLEIQTRIVIERDTQTGETTNESNRQIVDFFDKDEPDLIESHGWDGLNKVFVKYYSIGDDKETYEKAYTLVEKELADARAKRDRIIENQTGRDSEVHRSES